MSLRSDSPIAVPANEQIEYLADAPSVGASLRREFMGRVLLPLLALTNVIGI
jgi:hypothetical protein